MNISGVDEASAMEQCDTSSSQSSFGDASDKASNCTLGSVIETVVLDAGKGTSIDPFQNDPSKSYSL